MTISLNTTPSLKLQTGYNALHMKILYISAMASQKALEDAKKQDPSFSSYAVQKFTRLLNEGFVKNGNDVQALSTFFLPNVGYLYHRHKEEENGIRFEYAPSLNLRAFRIVWLLVYCFVKVLLWGLSGRKNKVVFCDVLNVSACAGAILATKITRLPCVGIVTDMPGIGVGNNETNQKMSLSDRINRSYLDKFTHYVFLTEQMNNVINTKHRPYMVMEGLVDINMTIPKNNQKKDKRIVIYAGGLYERYGLKLLVDGFIQADVENTELWLYGNGPFVESLNAYCENHPNIKYTGIRPNEEVVEAELKATLLVNPRPTHEEFTMYSFPSKNMEYMVSGTPVLTTILPGMPKEYYPYVYLFDNGETTEGYAELLRHVLTLPDEELQEKGMKARNWVLENKNNIKQAKRIAEFIDTNKSRSHA